MASAQGEAAEKATTNDLIFVIGPPGAGKGTLCKKLAAEYDLGHISVGDELRRLISEGKVDEMTVDYVRRGEPLPVDKLLPVLEKAIKEVGGENAILLDGFPRRLNQIESVEEKFGAPRLVLSFHCPEDIARERVLGRRGNREGDDNETFTRRHNEFELLNPEILKHYSGKLLKIDTSTDTEESYKRLKGVLKGRKGWVTVNRRRS